MTLLTKPRNSNLNISAKKALNALFFAQFLSAFVDNMIILIALAIITKNSYPSYYLPFVQSTFLAAYIVFSPWVGRLADKFPKSNVLLIGNIIKALGIISFLIGMDPALSNAIVGIGAVVYSPAKYGILPILTSSDEELLKANSKLETYTILAILTGTIAGGYLSEQSIFLALVISFILYSFSILINIFIPRDSGNRSIRFKNSIKEFGTDIKIMFNNKTSHFSIVGTGTFWMASAVLRLILFAWIPITLEIKDGTSISFILSLTGIGIIIGAIITPYILKMKDLHKTFWFGLFMGVVILFFTVIHSVFITIISLISIGLFGGIFIVPMNTCLQKVGHNSIGTGKTIAIQNFLEFSFMFIGAVLFTFSQKASVPLNYPIIAIGFIMIFVANYIYAFYKKNKHEFYTENTV